MRMDEKRVEELLEQLKNEDKIVRENSVYILGEIALTAQELSKNTLKNSESLNKMNALTMDKMKQKVAQSLVALLSDSDRWARGNSAEALGKLGDKMAVIPLLVALTDNDKVVRYSAAEALGEIGASEAIDGLTKALQDEEWSVRLASVESLGHIGTNDVVSALEKLVKDENKDVAERSLEIVAKLKQEQRKAGLNNSEQKARKRTAKI